MNQREARIHIRIARPVTAGALSGRTGAYLDTDDASRLDGECRRRYEAAVAAGTVAYTVLSYGTPIAFLDYSGWVVLAQKHTVTTSRHQNLVRQALVGKDVEEVTP